MAEAAEHEVAGTTTGTTVPAGAEHHAEPELFGWAAPAFVSLAMIVFISILLWKKVPAAIAGSLDRKIATIRSQLDEAARLRKEAEALKAEYEARLATAAKEADEMRARAEEDAQHVLDQAQKDATDLIARRQKMAEDKIAAAERAAVAQVRAKAAKAATAAAEALIVEHHDAAADKALVDQTIKGLGSLN